MLDAAFHLRIHREGVLIADGIATPRLRFVVDPGTAELVFPVDGAISAAEEMVLFVPEEEPEDGREMQLLLGDQGARTGGITDRWTAYHGAPRWSGFLACRIHGARFDGRVLEESEVLRLNQPLGLGRLEGSLLRRLNDDKSRLRAACVRFARVAVPDPIAVGVDKFGVDVRATFGIVRLDWGDSTDPARSVEELLGSD